MMNWEYLDRFLIIFYRITGNPVADFFTGTFCTALIAVFIGELTISAVFKINKNHIDRLNSRLSDMHRLSMEALKSGDKTNYKACNKEANDAFGQVFFNMFALSAASLWPAFFALAWMQKRFSDIGFPIPFIKWTVNYVAVFIICFILAKYLTGKIKHRLPLFQKDF